MRPKSVRHSIEWLEDAVNVAPEERATVGDLRLEINQQNVTKHIIGDNLCDHVTVALYGLVSGLVHDWWTIFGARDREFSLRAYRTGYLLPDIRMQFDGAAFEIWAVQSSYPDPDLRFWGGPRQVMSRTEAETWLSALIDEVLARMSSKGIRETSANLRWRRIQASLQSDSLEFCEAAGSLGLDPYQIDEQSALFIEKAESLFDQERLVEFAAGARDVDRSRLLEWVERMNRHRGFQYRLADLRPVVDAVTAATPLRHNERAWAAGYRRARAMRRQLNLDQTRRLASFAEIARFFGAAKSFNLAPKVDGISALRRETPNGIDIHVRNHGDRKEFDATHRFALARAIGDTVCFPEPETAPVNRLLNAYRQAAGRAFAAEFLAPVNEILSMQNDERDTFSMAAEFGVSQQVIEHQIENRERIEEACN